MGGRNRLENAGDGDLCLFIEPYGEDYWLRPGDVFTVKPVAADGIDVWFTTVVWERGITVWLHEEGWRSRQSRAQPQGRRRGREHT